MNVDFVNILLEHFVVVVFVACLIVGYVVKHASFLKWIPNNDIPIVLVVVGAVLNCVVGKFDVESIVYGAMMGLASTGSHQAFKRFVERRMEKE